MARRYVHELPDWPHLHWDEATLSAPLAQVHFRRGQLLASMESLGFDLRQETVLQMLTSDVTQSSAIEGERLDQLQVRSSIARRMGMDQAGLPEPERHVEGVVEMMLDATQRYAEPLTEARIFGWHNLLFPTGYSGMHRIVVGRWRDDSTGPMQVVSGPLGKERVHYQAPAAERLPAEMAEFLRWFESESLDPVVKAAVAHFHFETLHPLDDGNGRVGRAIMDLALARADQSGQRFYSMSEQIHRDRNAYYDELEIAQRSSLDVTGWVHWFLGRMEAALDRAESLVLLVRRKQAFWDAHRDTGLNERQIKVLNRLLDGFEGKLQTRKYAKLAKCSPDTALRDLTDLVARGILVRGPEGGRSVSYGFGPD